MSEFDDILTPDVRFHLVRKMERHKVLPLAGPELLPHEKKYLEFHNVAGVILFQRNIRSLSQVGELVASVATPLSADGLTPLVMADHEGDFVSELQKIIGAPPSALAIAATGDPDLAREVARETGAVMRKLGINVVLAPVADLFLDAASPITGLRTFGSDPARVAEFVRATVEGYREAGVAACVKHFPGHGATSDDSHETLPEVKKSLADMRAEDLVPFRAAMDSGAELVMLSHVAYPMGRDELVPASFDSRLIHGLLREEMQYNGVVITDSLEMAGARWYVRGRFGGMSGGFERTLLAGADLMLHTRPIPEHVQMEGEDKPVMSINVMETIIKTLEQVVDRGRIDEKLAEAAQSSEPLRNILTILDASSSRVERLRKALPEAVAARPQPSSSKVIAFNAYPSVPPVYREVADRSLCAGASWENFEPLSTDRAITVIPIEWAAGESLKKQDMESFLDGVQKSFPRWTRAQTVIGFAPGGDGDLEPQFAPGARPAVVDAARWVGGDRGGASPLDDTDDDVAFVFSARGVPEEEFLVGLQAFAELKLPQFIIVTGWPLADWIPEGVPVLYTLGASPQVAAAVAKVLGGSTRAEGSLGGLVPPLTAGRPRTGDAV